MDEKNAVAKKWYEKLCAVFDAGGWEYEKQEEIYKVSCKGCWEDESVDIHMHVDAQREVAVVWICPYLAIPKDMYKTMAHAVNVINDTIIFGSFDFGQARGNLLFRCTSPYKDTEVNEAWFDDLLRMSCDTVSHYMSAFRRVAKGYLSVDDLYEELRK